MNNQHPAVTEFFRNISLKGAKKSAQVRRAAIREKYKNDPEMLKKILKRNARQRAYEAAKKKKCMAS